MATKENRRATRSRHDSVLEILDDSGSFIDAVGRLVDVSQVGLCFVTMAALDKGQKIKARLRLLKEGRLEISGHVVWTRKKLNGILYGVELDAVHTLPSPDFKK